MSTVDTAVDTVVPSENAPGWLMTGAVLMTTDRLPCDTAQLSKVTALFITTEPVRAFKMILAGVAEGETLIASNEAKNATRLVL